MAIRINAIIANIVFSEMTRIPVSMIRLRSSPTSFLIAL